jgi:phospholipid/cholesterol/gamma-HCH transport system substrate-binding protein
MSRSTIVRHERAVGLFVTLTAVLLGGGLAIKGTKGAIGSRELVFHADAGHDLRHGATVTMQGLEVGEVSDVELDANNSVLVRIKVWPEFRDHVHADAVAAIVPPALLGSPTVELTPGRNGAIKNGDEIRPEVRKGLMDAVSGSTDDLKKIVERVNKMADKADSTLGQVNEIVSKINAGQGVVGKLVNDPELADQFVATVKDTRAVLDDVKEGRGAFALLKDEKIVPDIRETIADVRSMSDAVARGEGSLGRLMTNDTIVVQGEGVLKDVRSALARLDEITKDATATTEKVQSVLDSTKGAIDKLDGTIKNAEKVTAQLAEVTEKVNKGQGTLAKLVNDDALFKETKALLKELRESVEDLREQAPINSFIGVVFSAF